MQFRYEQTLLIFLVLLLLSSEQLNRRYQNDRSTGAIFKIGSKLAIKTQERHRCHPSDVFIVNSEQISLIFLGFFYC